MDREDEVTAAIDAHVIRCSTSKHVELVFESDTPLTAEAFYDALCTFVERWNEYPQNLFRYYDQKFPFRQEH